MFVCSGKSIYTRDMYILEVYCYNLLYIIYAYNIITHIHTYIHLQTHDTLYARKQIHTQNDKPIVKSPK